MSTGPQVTAVCLKDIPRFGAEYMLWASLVHYCDWDFSSMSLYSLEAVIQRKCSMATSNKSKTVRKRHGNGKDMGQEIYSHMPLQHLHLYNELHCPFNQNCTVFVMLENVSSFTWKTVFVIYSYVSRYVFKIVTCSHCCVKT